MTRIRDNVNEYPIAHLIHSSSLAVYEGENLKDCDSTKGSLNSYYDYLRYLLWKLIDKVSTEGDSSFHEGTSEYLQSLATTEEPILQLSNQNFILTLATKLGLIPDPILSDEEIWYEYCYYSEKLDSEVCHCYTCDNLCLPQEESNISKVRNWSCSYVIQPDEDQNGNNAAYNKRIICNNCNDNRGNRTPYDYALNCGFLPSKSEALHEGITSLALGAKLYYSNE